LKRKPILTIFGMQHREETRHKPLVLPTSPQYCCYTTLWNAEVIVWTFTIMNSYWVPHAGSEKKIIVRPQNHWKSVTYLRLTSSKSIVPRSRQQTNWNDASTASGPLWVARLLNVLFGEWRSIYTLAFVLEADILSTCCDKDDVMW